MRAFLFSILTLAVCSACSESAAPASAVAGAAGSHDSSAAGQGGSAADLPVSLELQASVTDLAPRQELDLILQTSPPGVFKVRFALPTPEGSEPLDAVLSSSEAETNEDGVAQVRLTAPSLSTVFQVRASVGSVLVTRELAVIDSGSTSVRIEPVYGGNRPIVAWTASARAGESCADHQATPPDGAFKAEPVGPDQRPLIENVPAGVPVAIVLRSGHFVSGCASVEMLPAGPTGAPPTVKVSVLDRPLQLNQTELDVAFDLQQPDAAWAGLLATTSAAIQQAVLGSSVDDPDALLDGMRLALDSSQRDAYDAARDLEGWDALVASHFGLGAATHVRTKVLGWLNRGQASFDAAAHLFVGTLTPIDDRSTELTLMSMAGLTATQASVTTPALMTWSADADDNLVLGTSLYFSASRLLAALAEDAARVDHPLAPGAAEALALALDCEGLGGTLSAAGASADLAFAACDGACMSKLCKGALAGIWKRARDVTSTSPVELAISATAQAQVGDLAELSSFAGTWVGQLPGSALSTAKTSTGGALGGAQQPAAQQVAEQPTE